MAGNLAALGARATVVLLLLLLVPVPVDHLDTGLGMAQPETCVAATAHGPSVAVFTPQTDDFALTMLLPTSTATPTAARGGRRKPRE